MTFSVRFTVVFDTPADAERFASYWGPRRKDTSGLSERDWPKADEWLNPTCARQGALVRAGGDVPSDLVVEGLLPDLRRGTQLVILQVWYDGQPTFYFRVRGKKATALQAMTQAIELKLEPRLLLGLALGVGQSKVLTQVLKSGVDPSLRIGGVPAIWSAETPEQVLALLDAGADPTVAHGGETLLMRFAWHAAIVRRLLAAGLDPNANKLKAWDEQNTALLCAIEDRGTTSQAVAALLEGGADPNAGKRVPLVAAAERMLESRDTERSKYVKIIELLLAHGADPTRRERGKGDLRFYAERAEPLRALLKKRGLEGKPKPPKRSGPPGQPLHDALLDHDWDVQRAQRAPRSSSSASKGSARTPALALKVSSNSQRPASCR
jgi:hypothetical protein